MSANFRDRPVNGDDSAAEPLPCPFGDLAVDFSDSELRETAYEILVGSCRSSGGKPLTYVSQSERTRDRAQGQPPASLQRSLTSTAASKVKKALGLKSSGRKAGGGDSVGQERVVNAGSVGEMVRVQMGVSNQADSRIRRALLRIAAAQLGRRIDSFVLPLELLQQLKQSDFPTQQEYENWQRRNLKLLEAGLLLHPHLPLDKNDKAPQRLRQILRGGQDRPMETGKNSESMQVLRNVVISLACRTFDGSISETCHWADGNPLNLRLYHMLLEACFDVNDGTLVIEEIDEVLELINKAWTILGINPMLHNLCFFWTLFHRYVATGEVENDLLFAANNMLLEVEKDAKATNDPYYSKILSSILSTVLDWAEKKLFSYHDIFNSDNTEVMESVVALGVLAATITAEDISQEYHRKKGGTNVAHERVDKYVRSSSRTAFSQMMERVRYVKRSSKNKQNQLPILAILAEDVTTFAFTEKAIFSPILKRWHPLAAGAAVATLHSCYGAELKRFISSKTELTPDGIHVLRAADKLEKDLVQIAVEDAVHSEDGGKSIIREMAPYEAEALISNLVKAWIKTRVDRLKEWVDRSLQTEAWDPRANKEQFAPSAVEVLRMVDETFEAFFLLPIPVHHVLLPELTTGIDRCVQNYVLKSKSGCGTRSSFIPAMPALTRSSTRSKLNGVFKKKDKLQQLQRRKSQVGIVNGGNSIGIPQLCCRINTLHHIRIELEVLAKRINGYLRNSGSSAVDDTPNTNVKVLELSSASCLEGVQELCELTAYKVVFHDLSHVIWDGLYVGEASSSRIEPFLQELDKYLEAVSSTVHDRVRTRLIADVMKASFAGFLLVLLAGGPSRAFTVQDYETIDEDFNLLTDLFWSNGDGLPAELIEKFSTTVRGVLTLFRTDTGSLIERFRTFILEISGTPAKSRLPLPPTPERWSPTEPNTILRVLCYRCDETASKFLKKTYDLPKKL